MNTRCSKERSQGSEASSNTLDLKSFGDIAGVHQGYHCAQRVLGVMRGQRQDDTSKEGNGAKWRRRRHAGPWPGKAFASGFPSKPHTTILHNDHRRTTMPSLQHPSSVYHPAGQAGNTEDELFTAKPLPACCRKPLRSPMAASHLMTRSPPPTCSSRTSSTVSRHRPLGQGRVSGQHHLAHHRPPPRPARWPRLPPTRHPTTTPGGGTRQSRSRRRRRSNPNPRRRRAGQGPRRAPRRPHRVRRAARLAARRAGRARPRRAPRRQGTHAPLAAHSASVAPLTAPTGSVGGEARSGHRGAGSAAPSRTAVSTSGRAIVGVLRPTRAGAGSAEPFGPRRRLLGTPPALPPASSSGGEVEEGDEGVAAWAARVSPPSRPRENDAGVASQVPNYNNLFCDNL